MPPKSSPVKSAKSSVKKINKTDLSNIKEEIPLFAGLDDYILEQAIRKKEETQKADDLKEQKKKAVAKQIKKKTSEKPQPKRVAKVKETKPLDPNAILLSVTEMCTLLKISRATLVRMDKSGKLPGRIKMGGSVRFHRETVETWLQNLITTHPTP